MCICPQHVCSGGTTTSCPSRSRIVAVARAASGNIVSATQLANKPTLIVDHSWSVGPTGPLEQHFTHRGEFAAFVALAKAGAIVDEHYRKRTVLGVRVL